MKIIEKEIECLKRVETKKQQLVSQFDYSVLSIFRAIDKFAHGKINSDNLRLFLRQFECSKELNEADIAAWIARYDQDVDGGLGFTDLIIALQTLTNYQPKMVQKANGTLIQEEPIIQGAEEGMEGYEQIPFQDGFSSNMAGQIQIDEVGGMSNLQTIGQKSTLQLEGQLIKGGDNSMTIGILKSGHASAPTRSTAYTNNIGGGVGYSTIGGSQVVAGEQMSFENQ